MKTFYRTLLSITCFLFLFLNFTNLYASKLLYIYSATIKTDSTQAVNFKTLFDSFGHTTTLIKTNQIISTQLSQYDLIIMSNSYWEGDAASVTAIKNSGKGIIALGAGISIFDQLQLTIGWGNSMGGVSGTSWIVLSNSGLILTTPNTITVPTDSTLSIATSGGGEGLYGPYTTKPDVVFFARASNYANYMTLAFEKNKYFYWGSFALATDLTAVGKNLLQNIISYVLKTTDIQNPGDKIVIPNYFELRQNYPNPFNPTTTITYSLPKAVFVTLKIYDGLGREVITLVSENKLPGKYEVKFDGTKLSSGVYFYKLTAGDFVETKKLVLIK
ncbi:MAG: T9SS type A sorting domain-containing protein [Bacteroidetes bacterium]|nr:T9SS type A sorting domain-containing protein [Bacteroidota bacterium]